MAPEKSFYNNNFRKELENIIFILQDFIQKYNEQKYLQTSYFNHDNNNNNNNINIKNQFETIQLKLSNISNNEDINEIQNLLQSLIL